MQLATPSTDSLSKRLDTLINDIERSAKMAKMVSMNASVIAVRSRADSNEAFAFEAVASQIMDISQASLDRIDSLRSILQEMDSLTAIINKAGRQRMLSQRYMKLALTAQLNGDQSNSIAEDMLSLRQHFEQNLRELLNSPLNTPNIAAQLSLVQSNWTAFIQNVELNDLPKASQRNETVLVEMNKAVQLYESLVRKR
ncbi:hypothetical protein VDG1235_3614 [Verrucomicrobiia bacterium DG1235]|nr:hypothetical protein VDG1235_3614 [Verrucomicrobiae bacterium DG1235]